MDQTLRKTYLLLGLLAEAVVFCKVGLRSLLPEISENLKKNKNEIPVFLFPPTHEKAQGFIIVTTGANARGHWKHDQC